MNFWNYIQGARKGKEAHRIEKEAMQDPFLADALEGYEKVGGNHQKEVAKLQREVNRRQKQMGSTSSSTGKKFPVKAWAIAASILLVAGVGAWFVIGEPEPPARETLSYVTEDKIQQEIQPETQINEESEEVPIMAPQESPAKPVPETSVSVPPEVPAAVSEEVSDMPPSADMVIVADAEEVVEKSEEIREAKRTATELDTRVVESEEIAVEPKKAIIESDTPQPVVGLEAYHGYIKRNLKHPADEECRDMKGEVTVVFKIGESGRPYNIRVTQGLCSSINQEAIRLIIHGPDWKKGRTSDEATIKINF